jgi:hypothetical protein
MSPARAQTTPARIIRKSGAAIVKTACITPPHPLTTDTAAMTVSNYQNSI